MRLSTPGDTALALADLAAQQAAGNAADDGTGKRTITGIIGALYVFGMALLKGAVDALHLWW